LDRGYLSPGASFGGRAHQRPIPASQSVTLQITLDLPAQTGSYTLQADMVHEGVTWFESQQVVPFAQTLTLY
jgi:hypothetical protein